MRRKCNRYGHFVTWMDDMRNHERFYSVSLSARPCSLALTTGCQTRAQDAEATRLVVRSITSLQSILQNAANCNVRSYPKADIYRWLGNVR